MATKPLVFGDPGPSHRTHKERKYLTDEVVEQLRKNPGRWAILMTVRKGDRGSYVRQQHEVAARYGWPLQFTTRAKQNEGQATIYVRWSKGDPDV